MTLTNPLIHFPEYDSLPEEEECQLPEKEEVKVETKNRTNPLLAFPEYEKEAHVENRSKTNAEKRTVNHRQGMNSSLKRQITKRPAFNSDNEIKSGENMKGRTKPERKKKESKPPHTVQNGVTVSGKTWGVPLLHTTSMMPTQPCALSLEGVGGFDWNATAKDLASAVSNVVKNDSETEESDEEIPLKKKKLTPAEKRAKALQEEKIMKKKEKELLKAEEDPQSPDHFERLLIGSPNSAELWIKYMGYHAVNADIDKARAIARRGLKRIDPQLTSSKLDVWIALLNLEHTFSPPETFKETFTEALKCNDDYAINSRVLSLFTDSKNVTEVDQLTNIMIKKYKNNVENWLQCQNALMTVGLIDKARNLLQKALSVLTKKEHVTLLSRFALLENKHGFPEQGQALFENLLTSFPQRIDLLSVYVAMLIKSGSITLARSVLERAASNSLPVRKMRSIYMKWIAFEEAHGNAKDLATVEEAAKKYVSNILRPHKVENTQEYLQNRDADHIKREEDIEEMNSTKIENGGTESSNDDEIVSGSDEYD